VVPLFTKRGRRLAMGSLVRCRQWRYWPRWVVLAPTVFRWVLLALRYRSLSLPMLANPFACARGMTSTDGHIRMEDANRRGGISFAEAAGSQCFEVIYCRRPSAEAGEVVAISRLQPLVWQGDGITSLERGILGDRSLLPVARRLLRLHGEQLHVVLSKGEQVVLAAEHERRLGNPISRVEKLENPEWMEQIEAAVNTVGGYFVGVIVLKGHGTRLERLEMKPLSMDPMLLDREELPLLEAWRFQWQFVTMAFEAGSELRECGKKTPGWIALLTAWCQLGFE
jgi:hypothetical protein